MGSLIGPTPLRTAPQLFGGKIAWKTELIHGCSSERVKRTALRLKDRKRYTHEATGVLAGLIKRHQRFLKIRF